MRVCARQSCSAVPGFLDKKRYFHFLLLYISQVVLPFDKVVGGFVMFVWWNNKEEEVSLEFIDLNEI